MATMKKRLKVMVTAGGTREYIDDVRVVTNISTGALGCKVAQELLGCGAHVFYIHAKGSPMPVDSEDDYGRLTSEQFVTTADLQDAMKSFCSGIGMDVVVHSAAVSDFTFRRDVPVKLSSDSEEGFIDHLRQTIVRTPKIVKEVKRWCPDCMLMSFKFTVGKSRDEMLNIAYKSGLSCGADWVMANDKEEMTSQRAHIGYFVCMDPTHTVINNPGRRFYSTINGKDNIAKAIAKIAFKGILVPKVNTNMSAFDIDK